MLPTLLLREQPGLATTLLDLFERGKAHAYAHPGEHEIELPLAGLTLDETRTRLGGDPFPFGVRRNARAIDAFLQYAVEQGLASARLSIAEAFADPAHLHITGASAFTERFGREVLLPLMRGEPGLRKPTSEPSMGVRSE